MTHALVWGKRYGLLEDFDPARGRGIAPEDDLEQGVSPKVALWHRTATVKWAKSTPLIRVTVDQPVIVKRTSSGYIVYHDVVADRFARQKLTVGSTEDVPAPRSRPTTHGLRTRISLIPKFLKEVFTNPFRSFTLVKHGGKVFVIEKGVDLSDEDLSGADLRRADLRNANLQGTILVGADLEEANLAGAKIRGAVLRRANLRKANLEGVELDGADLYGADLWGAKMASALLLRKGGTHGRA